MLNIYLFTQDFWPRPGGVARFYVGLLKHYSACRVFTDVPGATELPGVTQTRLSWSLWPHWLPALASVIRYSIKDHQAWLAAGQLLPLGTVMWLGHCLTGRPYLVFVHGLDIKLTESNQRKRWLVKHILNSAAGIIVNSNFTKSLLNPYSLASEKVFVLYPGSDLVLPCPPERAAVLLANYGLANKKVLLTVGRLVKRKGLAETLQALADCFKNQPELVYVIVGEGPERAGLQALARAKGWPVIFTGAVSDEELAAWYSRCQLFITLPLASADDPEGFGIVYLEAQAAGKPVIGNYQGGVPEAVGEGGYLLKAGDNLSEICQRLLTDQIWYDKLAHQAKQRIDREFNWLIQINLFRDFLNRLNSEKI